MKKTIFLLVLASALLVALLPIPSPAASVVKVVRKADGGFQLLRDGKPYFIKGAGGDGSKPISRRWGQILAHLGRG